MLMPPFTTKKYILPPHLHHDPCARLSECIKETALKYLILVLTESADYGKAILVRVL